MRHLSVPPVQLTLCHPFLLVIGQPGRGKLPALGPWHCSGTSGQIPLLLGGSSSHEALPLHRQVCFALQPGIAYVRSSRRAGGMEHNLHPLLGRPKDL